MKLVKADLWSIKSLRFAPLKAEGTRGKPSVIDALNPLLVAIRGGVNHG